MTTLNYDKVDDEKIKYGILFGNEKIVFIKVGADGNIRGYQDKYLKMAHRVHARIGDTFIAIDQSVKKTGFMNCIILEE